MDDKCSTCPLKDCSTECYSMAINNPRLCELASSDPGYRSIVERKSLDPDAVVKVTAAVRREITGESKPKGGCGCGGR